MAKLKDQYRTKNIGEFPDRIRMILETNDPANKRKKTVQIIVYEKKENLRYGTNPHQSAAIYVPKNSETLPTVGDLKEIKTGKGGLSQTNFEDIDRALRIVGHYCDYPFSNPTVAVMKHVNSAGVAQNEDVFKAFEHAWATDTTAAFGSTVGFNCEVTKEVAEAIMTKKGDKTRFYVECIVAPSFAEGVAGIFNNTSGKYQANPNIRVFEVDGYALEKIIRYRGDGRPIEFKTLQDGTLIMSDQYLTGIKSPSDLTVVTKRKPTKNEFDDMIFGWYICINTRSNGVIFTKDLATIAVGTGQQERVRAIKLGIRQANEKMHGGLRGSVLASDGFIPNADNIEAIVKYGITAIIQPGGSNKDEIIIEACNKAYGGKGIAMVFTKKPGEDRSERCFAHF